MQRLSLLLGFMLMLLPCSYAAETDDPQWSAFGRISTPLTIWQHLIEIEEIKPVYEACRNDFANLLPTATYAIPGDARIDETFYFAIGQKKKQEESQYFVWVNGADNKTRFIGTYPSIFVFINPAYKPYRASTYEDSDSARRTENMEMPQALLALDDKSMLHIKILRDSLLDEIKSDLENELNKEDKLFALKCHTQARKLTRLKNAGSKQPEAIENLQCPLGGSYSIDDSGKKYVCNHIVKAIDYRNTPLKGAARQALALVECLENLSDIELKVTTDSTAARVEFSWNAKAVSSSKGLFESFPEAGWIDDIRKYDRLSPVDSMHFALDIDWIGFFDQLREKDPAYDPLCGKKPAELLPEGLIMLSTSGAFNPFMRKLPQASLSLGMTAEKIANIKSLLSGTPVRSSEYEVHGRDLEAFEIPDLGHAFNSDADTDHRIFVLPGVDGRSRICFGEESARRQLELDCGETKAVSLWHDIDVPVKFAMAFRADACAMALLKTANETRFSNEIRNCLDNISTWRMNNREVAEKIKETRVIPDDLKKCCNRDGIVLDGRYGFAECAVHQFRNISCVEDQFYQANIASDRWLRIYVRRGEGKSSLVVDLIRAVEVK